MVVPFLLQNKKSAVSTAPPKATTTVRIAAVGGLLFALNNGLFNTAITFIPASNAIFLANTAVIWVGLLSMIIYKEKLSIYFWVGVPMALVGVLLITSPTAAQPDTFWLGNLIALAGGFFYGLNLLYNNVARRRLSAITYMLLFNITACLAIFVAILLTGVPFYGFDQNTYIYLFALGFVAQGIGFLAVVQSQAVLPASTVSTVLLAQPLLALVLAFFILGERPSTVQLVGITILFIGIVLANRRNFVAKGIRP